MSGIPSSLRRLIRRSRGGGQARTLRRPGNPPRREIARQLGGEARYDWRREGLVVELTAAFRLDS